MDLFQDWFRELLVLNENVKNERAKSEPFLAVPAPVVELIFLVCLVFEQPDEVRYLSVELFDRFIRLHFVDLVEKVWKKETHIANEQWKLVEQKIDIQSTLRMLSCIQIASKFIVHTQIIRPKQIQAYLKSEGRFYTLSMILSSEMRVWRTLKLRINIPTVLTYVDIIFQQLKFIPQFVPLITKEIYQRAYLLIDVVYLHHQEIYRKLFYTSTGRWDATVKERQEFFVTESDVLYRATAVVALSITYTSKDLDYGIYEQLSFLTKIPTDCVQALSNVINQVVIS